MSVHHKIHIANDSSEDIFVLPVPNTDWIWADVAFDVASTIAISVATAGTGTAAASGNAVKSLSSLEKVIKIAKMIATATQVPRQIATWVNRGIQAYNVTEAEIIDRAKKDLLKVTDFLVRDALKVKRNSYEEVFKEGVWSPTRYISPSGIGAAFGASNMTLFIINESLTRLVKFHTNGDYSWIVKDNEVVRAEYGRIWQESRKDGFYRFSIGDTLYSSQFLLPGQCLSSPNGDYDFVYEHWACPVVYKRDKPKSDSIIWGAVPSNANTDNVYRYIDAKLCMQLDGNVVIYDHEGNATWAHNRGYGVENEQQLCKLVMQDDGNLVVYSGDKALWDIRSAQEDNKKYQEMMSNIVAKYIFK